MTERVWRAVSSRCHTAECVHLLPRRASRGPQVARRGMPTVRRDNTIANGVATVHAALSPTLRSGGENVVQRIADGLSDALRIVPFEDGQAGAPCRQPDSPRQVERPALYGMPRANDGGAERDSPRLRRRNTGIRPPERPVERLTRQLEGGCAQDRISARSRPCPETGQFAAMGGE